MRKLLPIFLLPVILAIIAAAVAPKLASEERLHAEATMLLRQATGVPVSIGGSASFSVFPWPSLNIDEVAVADGPVQLAVPHVRIVLDLLPLLTGRARADYIELSSPDVTVTEAGLGLDPLSAVFLRLASSKFAADVYLTDGRLRVLQDGHSEVIVPQADLHLAVRGGADAAVSGKVMWRDEPLDIDLSLGSLGALATGGAGRLRAKISGPPVHLTFDGAARLAGGPVAEGALSVEMRQLRTTLEWLDMDAPTERGFGPFALSGRVQMSPQNAALSDARIELDGNVSEGGFTLRLEGGRPVVQGSLASDRLDLTPYGQLAISDPDSMAWNHEMFDLSRLTKLDLDLRLSASQVLAGSARLDNVAASAVVKSGKLILAIGEAEAWNGLFRSALQLSPGANGGTETRVDLAAENVALAPALGDVFRIQRLEGNGSFRFAAVGAGKSVAELVSHLSGTFNLSGQSGALVGIDVGRVLSRLEQRPLSGSMDLRGGRTSYDRIGIDASIRDGIARLGKLEVESARMRISVGGESSIAERDLDLIGVAQLMAPAKSGVDPTASFELPFIVRGNWDQPIVLPDPQALIRRSGAAKPLFGQPRALGVAGQLP